MPTSSGPIFFTFFHNLGLLVDKGLLDFDMGGFLYGVDVVTFWEKMGPIYEEIRVFTIIRR